MMISDVLSKHVRAVKSVLKKLFKINDIQLVHLLVVWCLGYDIVPNADVAVEPQVVTQTVTST